MQNRGLDDQHTRTKGEYKPQVTHVKNRVTGPAMRILDQHAVLQRAILGEMTLASELSDDDAGAEDEALSFGAELDDEDQFTPSPVCVRNESERLHPRHSRGAYAVNDMTQTAPPRMADARASLRCDS